jgi:hypothetical protein
MDPQFLEEKFYYNPSNFCFTCHGPHEEIISINCDLRSVLENFVQKTSHCLDLDLNEQTMGPFSDDDFIFKKINEN